MKEDVRHDSAPAGSGSLPQSGLLVVGLLMLLFLLLGTAYAVLGLRDSQQWVRHTDEVRIELVRLQGTLVDAETGQRGYLATGDPQFLQPYTEALVAWPNSFERIRALTVDNPQQERKLAQIHALIERKLSDLKRGMSAREGGVTGAGLVPLVAAGKRTMDEIRAGIGDMQREELLLDEQRIRESARHERILFALLFAAAACLMLVCGTLWASRHRQQRNDRLRLAELYRALQETARYRLLVESVNDATFILDPKGFVTTWNAAAERIKGYAAADIIGKHFSTFYPPDDIAAGKPPQELVDAARDGFLVDEGWRLRKDGSRFWANVTITAMRSMSGELVGFAKVTRDLTERVR